MTENKRFTIKSQDDYFGITDNNVEDKMNVINGIHTEIEAKWLCDLLNALHEENKELKKENVQFDIIIKNNQLAYIDLEKENEQLKKQIGNLEHTRDFCAECCERLEKENKQLESEIREVRGAYEQLWMHKYK